MSTMMQERTEPNRYESPFKTFPSTKRNADNMVNRTIPYPTSEYETPIRQDPGQKDISDYSPVARQFYEIYQRTISDVKTFTPSIQLKWCETLLWVSQDPDFISHYTINAEKLKRELNNNEIQRNAKIIIEHAFKVLTKLIKLKYPDAYYLMGCLYSHRVTQFPLINYDFINQNDRKALNYYCEAAKMGHSESSYRAGICYEFNKGTNELEMSSDAKLSTAITYYKLGALKCNNTDCMFKLGTFYLNGDDVKEGIQWLEKAINIGKSSQACYELGKIYEFDTLGEDLQKKLNIQGIIRDPIRSIKYYYKCAEEFDYPLAQWRLGTCYEFGELGLPVNCIKSIAWYMRASNSSTITKKRNSNPVAMLSLAGWFFTGSQNVLIPDYEESFKWIYKSCLISEGKLARSEYILGYYYYNGIGTTTNYDLAIKHMNNAAKLGHSKAIDLLTLWSS